MDYPKILDVFRKGFLSCYFTKVNIEKLMETNNIFDQDNDNYYTLNNKDQIIGLSFKYNANKHIIRLIENLNEFSNLKYLNISNNQIENLNILEKMDQLVELNFANNKIKDYSFLKFLNNIETLNFGNNFFNKKSILNQLPNFKKVIILFF